MRIVLDTNILISSLFWGGNPRTVLERCVEGIDELISSREQFVELYTVMQRPKFKLDEVYIQYYINAIEDIAKIVVIPEVVRRLCRDRDDDYVIACAVVGNAQCLITGDEDLLVLRRFQEISILSPEEYLQDTIGL